jgi:hypothetical protein
MKTLLKTYFVKEVLEYASDAIKKAGENARKSEESLHREISEPKMQGEVALLKIKETRLDRGGKLKTLWSALKIIKVGNEWKIDNLGSGCWSCNGSGVCSRCNGTGTREGKCFLCKGTGTRKDKKCGFCQGTGKRKRKCYKCRKTSGKCSRCKGEGFNWERK